MAFSLVSMALLGTFAYFTSANLLQEISLRQLDALAESKKRDLTKVYESWEDKVKLLRTREILRQAVLNRIAENNPESRQALETIVRAITVALPKIDRLILFDSSGQEIASSSQSQVSYHSMNLSNEIQFEGTFRNDNGLSVALSAGLESDGNRFGGILIFFDASEVYDVTEDYTGLGESGESFVVVREGNMLKVLNPLRFSADGTNEQITTEASDDLQHVFPPSNSMPDISGWDYRGERVWLASRYLENPGWGLVVKVDIDEEEQRAVILRESIFDIAIALSAFAILGGALLGIYLARPIQKLTDIVERMRQGESGLRVSVEGDDEIAYLGESLNLFLDHLEDEQDRNA